VAGDRGKLLVFREWQRFSGRPTCIVYHFSCRVCAFHMKKSSANCQSSSSQSANLPKENCPLVVRDMGSR